MIPAMQVPGTTINPGIPNVGVNGHNRVADVFGGMTPTPMAYSAHPVAYPYGVAQPQGFVNYQPTIGLNDPYQQMQFGIPAIQPIGYQTIPGYQTVPGFQTIPSWNVNPFVNPIQYSNPMIGCQPVGAINTIPTPQIPVYHPAYGITNPFVQPFGYNPIGTTLTPSMQTIPTTIGSPLHALNAACSLPVNPVQPVVQSPFVQPTINPNIIPTFGGIPIQTTGLIPTPFGTMPIGLNPVTGLTQTTPYATTPINFSSPFINNYVNPFVASPFSNPYLASSIAGANPWSATPWTGGTFGNPWTNPLLTNTVSPFWSGGLLSGTGVQFDPFVGSIYSRLLTGTQHPLLANRLVGNPIFNAQSFGITGLANPFVSNAIPSNPFFANSLSSISCNPWTSSIGLNGCSTWNPAFCNPLFSGLINPLSMACGVNC
jgi:hypothetical protein